EAARRKIMSQEEGQTIARTIVKAGRKSAIIKAATSLVSSIIGYAAAKAGVGKQALALQTIIVGGSFEGLRITAKFRTRGGDSKWESRAPRTGTEFLAVVFQGGKGKKPESRAAAAIRAKANRDM